MSVRFISGATTVILDGPSSDYPKRQVKRQALGRSAGGTVYTYDKGVATYEIEIELVNLTEALKDSFQSFFDSTINGVTNTFTFKDEAGDNYVARFLSANLEFAKQTKNLYSVRVTLELGSMP